MKLSDWARQQGISYITAWRWFQAPCPCPPIAYWDNPSRSASPRRHHGALVSSADQKEDLERQVQRLAQEQGWTEVKVNRLTENERNFLRDPQVVRIVMEHRDRLARFGFDLLEAALAASGRHVVVIEDGEVTDDLVQDVLEILTSA